ncbi:MAG: NUDIX hydrolase [Candidatus Omnitrophica bacterium]|nr:NUDIX hydrolase [Candidatus Omnitrophota bacterium]
MTKRQTKRSSGILKILKEGKFLRLLKRGSWEFVQRNNCTGIVIIVAMTDERKVLLVEQHREPVQSAVIEFPAGLANDQCVSKRESLMMAAKRELLEETGYRAQQMVKLIEGPTSGGSSSDKMTVFRASGLQKISQGGGDHTENIKVHEIPLNQVDTWILKKQKEGCLVDPKIYAGLYFLKQYNRKNL